MTDENNSQGGKKMKDSGNGILSGIYGMGFIGAAVYYIQHSDSFWAGVLGILKALVWPAMLIYKLFELLKL